MLLAQRYFYVRSQIRYWRSKRHFLVGFGVIKTNRKDELWPKLYKEWLSVQSWCLVRILDVWFGASSLISLCFPFFTWKKGTMTTPPHRASVRIQCIDVWIAVSTVHLLHWELLTIIMGCWISWYIYRYKYLSIIEHCLAHRKRSINNSYC